MELNDTIKKRERTHRTAAGLDAVIITPARYASLKLLEYIPRGNRDLEARIMRNLKHLLARAGLTDWELNMLHGICGQIEKKMGK